MSERDSSVFLIMNFTATALAIAIVFFAPLVYSIFFISGMSAAHSFYAFKSIEPQNLNSIIGKVAFFAILLLSILLFIIGTPLEYFFLPHWVLAEVFLRRKYDNSSFALTIIRTITFTLIYYSIVVHHDFNVITLVAIAIFSLMEIVAAPENQKRPGQILDLVTRGLLLSSLYFKENSNPILFLFLITSQHYFLFFGITLTKKKGKDFFQLIGGHIAILGIFFCLYFPRSPLFISSLNLQRDVIFFGFIHIGLTYITSNLNPWPLTKFKRPTQ